MAEAGTRATHGPSRPSPQVPLQEQLELHPSGDAKAPTFHSASQGSLIWEMRLSESKLLRSSGKLIYCSKPQGPHT